MCAVPAQQPENVWTSVGARWRYPPLDPGKSVSFGIGARGEPRASGFGKNCGAFRPAEGGKLDEWFP
jgi:hypothetical protein